MRARDRHARLPPIRPRPPRSSRGRAASPAGELRGLETPSAKRRPLTGEVPGRAALIGLVNGDVDGRVIPPGRLACLWVRWWSRIRSIRCADSVSRCCWSAVAAGIACFVCDAGGGVNVELAEDATDRGTPWGERALSFEVLVGLAAVVAAIAGGKET